MILFAETLLRPFHRGFVITGVGVHPGAVVVRALAERLLADDRVTQDLSEEIDHLFRA
jgi:hypothetical protein